MAEDVQADLFAGQPPSFAPLDPRADRIGVIDVGSNSVRLVVYEGGQRSPAVIFNDKATCGLGAEIQDTGKLSPAGIDKAMRVLRRFAALAPRLKVGALAAVATAAVREASDGPDFVERVRAETGIRLRVASGADEARLAARGVLFGNPRAEGIVADLGGASLEFCRVGEGRTGEGVTTPLGPLVLAAIARQGQDVAAEVQSRLDGLDPAFRQEGQTLTLVGGAWRALAKVQMARTEYPLRVLHEYTLAPEAALDLGQWVAGQPVERLTERYDASSSRAPAMALTGPLLAGMVRALRPGRVTLSAFGLREGVCLDNIPGAIAAEDPLIAAARAQEARRARAPGYGAELGDWAVGLLGIEDAEAARLARAAALLSDVNWRTHPDYRTTGCWETVTRTTFTDLGHRGRVFLGAALIARYKARKGQQAAVQSLLDAETAARARRLGLAMRLAASLTGSSPGVLPWVEGRVVQDRLRLRLTGPARAMACDEVEKRLGALAKACRVTADLEIARGE